MVAIETVVDVARVRELIRSGKARRIRLDARLSLTEVAAALGVSGAAVARWESLERLPRRDVALRYMDLLDQLSHRGRR
jgi:transcriptional regulator with XRE-family HTH domain